MEIVQSMERTLEELWPTNERRGVRLIYIAGPYRDERGPCYVWANIMAARAAALEVWNAGGVAICPHLNTMLFDGYKSLPDHVWLRGDLAILERCDAVLLIGDWPYSRGATAEEAHAYARGIPIFESMEAVREFLAMPQQGG